MADTTIGKNASVIRALVDATGEYETLEVKTLIDGQPLVRVGATIVTAGYSAAGVVIGPASLIDNAIVRTDGVTGTLVQGYTSNTPTIDDNGGLLLPGHMGAGASAAVLSTALVLFSELSSLRGATVGFTGTIGADAVRGVFAGGSAGVNISDGFDCSGASVDIIGLEGSITGGLTVPNTVTPRRMIGLHAIASVDAITGLGSIAPTDIMGVYVDPLFYFDADTLPLRSYGVRIDTPGNGTTAWGAAFNGDVQVTLLNKLIFGGADNTVKGINWIQKNSGANQLDFYINSAAEVSLSATAFKPAATGGNELGAATTGGWASVYLKDTSAAFTVQIKPTSSTALNANRLLTLDMVNAARTIKLTGNPTLADWFDQAVKAASSPTFVGITATGNISCVDLATSGNMTIGDATTDTVRFNAGGAAAAPGTNLIGVIVDYFGTSATRVLTTPTEWLDVLNSAGAVRKIPLYA